MFQESYFFTFLNDCQNDVEFHLPFQISIMFMLKFMSNALMNNRFLLFIHFYQIKVSGKFYFMELHISPEIVKSFLFLRISEIHVFLEVTIPILFKLLVDILAINSCNNME